MKYLIDRRNFLEFLGVSAATLSSPALTNPLIAGKSFKDLSLSFDDKLLTANGIKQKILIKWQDSINSTQKFGINNDFIALISDKQSNNAYLWVNHEYPLPTLQNTDSEVSKADIDIQQESVGGTLLYLTKDSSDSYWQFSHNKKNIRFDAKSIIPFSNDIKIKNKNHAIGTFANCCGGQTPWDSFLSCEENYSEYYGDVSYNNNDINYTPSNSKPKYSWEKFYNYPPEHYGWVVEIDPFSGKSKKLLSLGRFAHEGATVVQAKDKRCVVYMGDDASSECIYKFIADKPNSLENGELFVANLTEGKWLSLDVKKNPKLKNAFKNQIDCLIFTRLAAQIAGGTPCARPEGIAINPNDKSVNICLTNDHSKNNYHGSILKIKETNNDPLSLGFSSETYLVGGEDSGFSCPDNIIFDSKGNMWFTTDMPSNKIGQPPYNKYGNNSMFLVPAFGKNAGSILRIATGPIDSELTGMCFDPEEKTMFISVQHPGESSKSKTKLTSHWPEGGNTVPKSAVVMLTGDFFSKQLFL